MSREDVKCVRLCSLGKEVKDNFYAPSASLSAIAFQICTAWFCLPFMSIAEPESPHSPMPLISVHFMKKAYMSIVAIMSAIRTTDKANHRGVSAPQHIL